MADQYLEKKVYYLGAWKNNRVDNQTISQINSQIVTEKGKGNRVKLLLSSDGLRIVKSSMMGKMLHEYIPLERIQFMTVSRNLPDLLMIISVTKGDSSNKFQVNAFRCANGLDAGVYIGTFKALQKNIRAVKVVKTTTISPQSRANEDDINWTLRNKEHDNSKRELKQLVDIHGEKAVLHKVGDGATVYIEDDQVPVMTNGHSEVYENGVRIPLYRKGKPSRLERESFESDVSDSRSEVSESALRNELETLSQELRDIKIMLEKSTGIPGGSEPGSPRDFEPVNVKVHTHTVRPDHAVESSTTNGDHRVESVVYTEEPTKITYRENGYAGGSGAVKVNVPDYRNSQDTSGLAYTVTRVSQPEVGQNEYTVTTRSEPSYEIVAPRTNTTSYESWKKNTMERKAIIRRSDLPERIQWKSRANRASHVVSTRPHSAMPVWASDAPDSAKVGQVEVRHHPAGYGHAYQRVSFNPRVVKMQGRKVQSLRSKGLSTTVARPIDKVYIGRPDAKHHSLSYRPASANVRPSILVKDTNGVQPNTQTVTVEQNNNVVKPDNDDELLDVSGIDLFKENSTEGVVIRT